MSLKSPILGPQSVGTSSDIWTQIIGLTIPNVAASLAMFSSVVITTFCVAYEDDAPMLAALGLGNLMGNILGFSVGVGLTSVLDTLVSQAYGAKNFDLASTHLNRARLIVTIAFIPSFLTLFFADSLLLSLGQDPDVSALAAAYTRAFVLGLPAFFYYCCSSAFLRSCQFPNPPLMANVLGTVAHLVLCILLVNKLGWGLWGAGLAMTCNNIVRCVSLEVFLVRNPELKGHAFNSSEIFSYRGIRHFLGLGIPFFIMVSAEWIAYELQSLFAGWVSTEGLAAHVACANVVAIVFMIPNGVSQSLSTLVGASLGEGLPKQSKLFAKKGGFMMLGIACTYGVSVMMFNSSIASMYSSDQTTNSILKSCLILTVFFVVFDAMNTTEASIIRGMGLQTRAAKYQMIGMFGVMLPVGFYLYRYMGIPGIWVGNNAGMLTSALLFLRMIVSADWNECSKRAIREAKAQPHPSI